MMDYLLLAKRTIRNRINTLSDEFYLDVGTVKFFIKTNPQ